MPEDISALTFQEKVLRAKGVVVVDFFEEWCVPCLELEPKLKELAQDYAGKATVYRLGVNQSETINDAYEVMGVPTLVVFSDGKMIGRQIGFSDQDPIGPVKAIIDSELGQLGLG